MPTPSIVSVIKRYESTPPDVQKYFEHLPALARAFPWEITMAYLFVRVELAQNRALRGGVVKLHRANSEVAESIIDSMLITRKSFLTYYQTIFGEPMPSATVTKLRVAEGVRDKTVHGKSVEPALYREAIVDVLDCAVEINQHVQSIAGFRPFGSMQGYKGNAQPLEKGTTRWLLRGLFAPPDKKRSPETEAE